MPITTDYLVIGTGVAGLSFALEAAASGDVLVVTKRSADESNTKYAQGGIAAVLGEGDSFAAHIADTLQAGAGLCHELAVDICVKEAPARIKMLRDLGARFDIAEGAKDGTWAKPDDTDLDLHLEGGHSARRVAHAADTTGREVERALLEAVARSPRVRMLEGHTAVDLITLAKYGGPEVCAGAYVFDDASGKVITILARAVILATGGSGKVYLYTTNPDVATGDGVAMAYRAGCSVANMEFIQFHPTCMFHREARSFLISEALRGEGGVLRTLDGVAFMEKYHPMKDLAPRDVVARAIDAEMKRRGDDYVLLDITHKPGSFVRERFPTLWATCKRYGFDMATEPIPVVPATHYQCGGVVTDAVGETEIHDLFAIGEVACTGLHGANRLASNSLLEGAVFGPRAAAEAVQRLGEQAWDGSLPEWNPGRATDSDDAVVVAHNWDEVRRTLWNYVGIVRTDKRLKRAKARIDLLLAEIAEYYWNFRVTRDLIELRNIALVGDLVIRCASARRESRGLHYTLDCPRALEEWKKDSVIPSPAR